MKEVEQTRLEEMLGEGDWVETLTPPDLRQVVAESKRRKRRRRAFAGSVGTAAVIAAVVVAQLLAGHSPGHGSRTTGPAARQTASGTSVIPWVAAKSATAPAPAACDPHSLNFSLGRRGIYHGFATVQIEVRNTSDTSCTVPGDIAVSALGAARGTVHVAAEQPTAASTLGPQEALMISVGRPRGCSAQDDEATGLSVSMGSITSPVLGNAQVRVDCGAPRVILTYVDQQDPPTFGLPLTAAIEAPPSVSAGSTLRYTVTLTNGSTTAIRFDDCPSYGEGLKISQVFSSYQLNCAGVAEIPAGGSVRFAMELAIPSGTPPAEDLLGWNLSGYSAGASVAISVN